MEFFVLTFLSAIFISLSEAEQQCPADKEEIWTYRGSKGPEFWGETFPACKGDKQSPIEIESEDVEVDENLAMLSLDNYNIPVSNATIENNGHTIKLSPKDGVQRTISVNGDTYSLLQLHFHWGFQSTFTEGSEHVIDGLRYAMEMHLVHLNAEGKIAVVGIFFQERFKKNKDLQPIVDQLPSLKYKGSTAQLESDLNLNSLLPANPTSFYRYEGSLTNPGCAEGVTWSVVSQPIPVGLGQMTKFRKLSSATKDKATIGCTIARNFRPVQPLNDRQVYASQ